MRSTYDGRLSNVDPSGENAAVVARSLEAAVRERGADKAGLVPTRAGRELATSA